MALPTLAQAKAYLRVQGTAEDTLIGDLLARAKAKVQGALGRSLAMAARTFTEYAETRRSYHTPTGILIPPQYLPTARTDNSAIQAPAITDADGTVLSDADDYYVGSVWDAMIRARPGISFGNGPYSITVYAGLEAAEDYATVIEPSLSAAILDVVADDYQRRSPGATNESTGGGVSTSYAANGLPMRAWEQIKQWAVIRV